MASKSRSEPHSKHDPVPVASAVVEAAVEEKSPVILQITPSVLKYAGLEYITALAKTAAQTAAVPVAIHLDHGEDFDTALKCCNSGFTSVMIDGSFLSPPP